MKALVPPTGTDSSRQIRSMRSQLGALPEVDVIGLVSAYDKQRFGVLNDAGDVWIVGSSRIRNDQRHDSHSDTIVGCTNLECQQGTKLLGSVRRQNGKTHQ
jgi:hypothetical protein